MIATLNTTSPPADAPPMIGHGAEPDFTLESDGNGGVDGKGGETVEKDPEGGGAVDGFGEGGAHVHELEAASNLAKLRVPRPVVGSHPVVASQQLLETQVGKL